MMESLCTQGASAPAPTPKVTKDEIARVLLAKRRMLLGIIQRVESDPSAAEDLLSVVTVRALAQAEQNFRGESDLSTYLGTIAQRVAADHVAACVRRKKTGLFYEHEFTTFAEDEDSTGGPEPFVSDCAASSETVAQHRQALRRVEQALGDISLKYPAAFRCWRLYRLEDQSYEDIASREGITEQGVRSRVHRVSLALEALTGLRAQAFFA